MPDVCTYLLFKGDQIEQYLQSRVELFRKVGGAKWLIDWILCYPKV